MEMLRIPQAGRKETPPPVEIAESAPAMEIAHVLFMDVVGFSQLRMQQQAAMQVELQNLVQATPEVQQARKDGKLIVRPTGDGMALLFLRDMLSPLRCALQLSSAIQAQDAQIKQRTGASIRLRMGIHSGSVLLVEDMNAQSDVAGEGIIIAQRVMDCGDAGHILISEDVAKKLLNIDPWPRYITDLGQVRVKHGVKVHLYNLYGRLDGPFCGNPNMPKKVKEDSAAQAEEQKKFRGTYFQRNPGAQKFLTLGIVLAVLGGGGWAAWTKVPAVPKFAQETGTQLAAWYKGMTEPKTAKAETEKPAAPQVAKNGKGGSKSGRRSSEANATRGSESTVANSGAQVSQVPDVTGRSYDDARQILTQEGFKIEKAGSGYNTSYGEGLVYRQYPDAGHSMVVGRSVKVRISKGDPPTPDMVQPEDSSDKGSDSGDSSGSGGGDTTTAPANEGSASS